MGGGGFKKVIIYIWKVVNGMSTYVNYRGGGGQSRAKNGQRSLRMTPYTGLRSGFHGIFGLNFSRPQLDRQISKFLCEKVMLYTIFISVSS